jgi:hypothetical protein
MSIFRKKQKWQELPLDEIRKRTKLLVIDDTEFYYLPLFKRDGYNIEKWDDVVDLAKLERGEFDIILLDIQGVGKEISPNDQGFGVLLHLRKVSPAQILIAYSNADWSVKYQEFFNMADAVIYKQKDYVEFKRTVDELLKERFSLGFYINRVVKLTEQYLTDTDKIRDLTANAILSRSTKKLERYLQNSIESKDTVNLVLQVVSIGLGIAALL